MTDLKEQARRLIELDGERTQGEWRERPWGDGSIFQGFSNVVCDEQELTLVTETLIEDARFIVHNANHAPAIAQAYLDQCEENERLREALGDLSELSDEENWRGLARQVVNHISTMYPEVARALGMSGLQSIRGVIANQLNHSANIARKALGDTDV